MEGIRAVFDKIDTIIFDLEGTIVENKINFLEMKKEILEILKEKYSIKLPESFLKNRVVEILDFVKGKLKNKDDFSKLFNDISKIADKYEYIAAKSTRLKENVNDVLYELKRRKIKLALLTNDGKKATEYIIKKLGLDSFFDIIITRDDMKALKPDPIGIEIIIKKLNTEKDKCIIVGDSKIDIEAANKAGIRAIGILGGFSKRDELERSSPFAIINSLRDLLTLDP